MANKCALTLNEDARAIILYECDVNTSENYPSDRLQHLRPASTKKMHIKFIPKLECSQLYD